jgi:hypothetical protein
MEPQAPELFYLSVRVVLFAPVRTLLFYLHPCIYGGGNDTIGSFN